MKSGYPDGAALAAFLASAFLSHPQIVVAGFDVETSVQAAKERFEEETGRTLFAAATSARTFDPPGGRLSVLNLHGEIAEITSVTAQGTAQVNLTDYRALPSDGPARGKPYNRLQFALRYSEPLSTGLWNALVVSGFWGYSKEGVPEDAWMAMLAAGALWLLPEIITQVAGGMTQIQEADITEAYGPKPFDYLRDHWEGLYGRALRRWLRVTEGIS